MGHLRSKGHGNTAGSRAHIDDCGVGVMCCGCGQFNQELRLGARNENVRGHAERSTKEPLFPDEVWQRLAALAPGNESPQSCDTTRMDRGFRMGKYPCAITSANVREEKIDIAGIEFG